ncbi:MAG: hydantoinase/oxoprolinase family protein [Rhodobacteraceae bacterium]|nr:hydantoinase/oxoprolinase family protein [Paracoccaceae bacterium]
MSLLLGVDTGGTYTDAVLIRDGETILASAKSLTTRVDLAVGIGAAVRAVLEEARVEASQIDMASLSTTLATNALVEGQGGRVGLVYIGFAERDLDRHDLREALAGDPVFVCDGGHGHAGEPAAPLDVEAIASWAGQQEVSGFAVAARFSTRNSAHEVAARDAVRTVTGLPVTCSHELSAKLNGPKRALTAVLNARLIALTYGLIARAEAVLSEIGIEAPMMVVRGDGALMSAARAMERPIETILSGPAASIVGARWLTGAENALVSDIGGTTTDIALLREGRPAIDPDGAQVGSFRTMVEAVAMRTHGLGGDSEVHMVSEGLAAAVTLGPRRVLPLALAAAETPAVLEALQHQADAPVLREHDGRFVRRVSGVHDGGLAPRDAQVLERLSQEFVALGSVLRSRMDGPSLKRLVSRGLVQVAALTPTDALHGLGDLSVWSGEAAHLGLSLMGRRRTGAGQVLAATPVAMAEMIVDQLTRQTSLALLETAFAEEGWDGSIADLARHPILQAGLSGHQGILDLSAGLSVPVIGLGASARRYYPAVGAALRAKVTLPEAGGVANAIGAVVGQITVRREGTVTAPSDGRYRVHLGDTPEDFDSESEALQALEDALSAAARLDAEAVGAEGISVRVMRDVRRVSLEARDVFVEARLVAEASGRPRIAA